MWKTCDQLYVCLTEYALGIRVCYEIRLIFRLGMKKLYKKLVDITSIHMDMAVSKSRKYAGWMLSPRNALKFNVGGASKRNKDQAE